MNSQTYVLLFGFILLGVGTVSASINILMRRSIYHRIKPESRPRRWVLYLLSAMFTAFVVWFPVWMLWPQSPIAKVLTIIFAITFGAGGLTLRWLGGLVDTFYKRKGWPLR